MKIDKQATFIRSRFTQVVQEGDQAIIWHSLFGNPKIVSRETLEFLDHFEAPQSLGVISGDGDIDSGQWSAVQELIDGYYLIPKGFDERAFLAEGMRKREETITSGSLIDYLELIMSEACNFRCTYCIHFNNLEILDRISTPKKLISFEVARETVDRFLSILREHGKKTAEINFGGGEPLFAWKVIRSVLKYCVKTYGSEFTFRFSINTNASLITEEIAKVLKEYYVEIASSIDGLREGNDQVRLTRSGKGTFDAIMKGFDTLAAQGYPLEGIAVTVNEHNFPYLDESIIDWAVQRGMVEVRIDIDVIGMVDITVKDIIDRLMRIRRYAKQKGINVPGFWSRPVENLNDSTLDEHIAFCGAVRGNSMCVSPLGKIYGCGYSNTQLGVLSQIDDFHALGGNYHCFIRDHLTGVMEMCKGCMIEGQCGGGCHITQEFARAKQTVKIERMCDFYRQMTRELLLEQLHEVNGGDVLQP